MMDPLIIPIVGMAIPIIIVPVSLGIKHARYLREVEHAEKMRAMELGRDVTPENSWSFGALAALIGAGVPIVAMGVAYEAGKSLAAAQIDTAWRAAGMIGLGGVICGTVLAAQGFARKNQAAPAQAPAKPEFDPESFDYAGQDR